MSEIISINKYSVLSIDVHKIVHDYLEHYGYMETLAAFKDEAGINSIEKEGKVIFMDQQQKAEIKARIMSNFAFLPLGETADFTQNGNQTNFHRFTTATTISIGTLLKKHARLYI